MDYNIKSKELRKDILRMIYEAKSGHPGGSLSSVEILIALYYNVMKIDPKNPNWEDRDRFILSKGHVCPALYAVLADKGYFPKEDLWTLRKENSLLQGHPDAKKTKGVDVNTGSLSQGASVAVGIAIAAKHLNKKYNVYALLGDGECDEGLVWESAMAASHYKTDNLTFILDYNKLQIDGANKDVMSIGNICDKFKAFGFEVIEVDGHNVEELTKAMLSERQKDKPRFICANTIKGKGVSFMENNVAWHGRAPKEDEYNKAILELEA